MAETKPYAPNEIKCITLKQPLASLVVSGSIDTFTRSFSTEHRGPLLIHASRKPMDNDELVKLHAELVKNYPGKMDDINKVFTGYCQRGGFIGRVNLIQVTKKFNFQNLRYKVTELIPQPTLFHYHFANSVNIPFIPWDGNVGLWDCPEFKGLYNSYRSDLVNKMMPYNKILNETWFLRNLQCALNGDFLMKSEELMYCMKEYREHLALGKEYEVRVK